MQWPRRSGRRGGVELRVTVQISPEPSQADKVALDKLLDQELRGFEHFYSRIQQERGFDGAPLATVERAAVKAYLIYASTERHADG